MRLRYDLAVFLLYSPLNQGLKHERFLAHEESEASVFTLQSIKSRIETSWCYPCCGEDKMFLLYSPLNQGLKR